MNSTITPQVDANGYRWPGKPIPLSKPPRMELEPVNAEQVRQAALFLSHCTPTKTVAIFSYGLKHTIESAMGTYIANGACIQAALDVGIRVEPAHHFYSIFDNGNRRQYDPTPLNGFVFVSRKSVRDTVRMFRERRAKP